MDTLMLPRVNAPFPLLPTSLRLRFLCCRPPTIMCAKQRLCNHPRTWTLPPAAFLARNEKKFAPKVRARSATVSQSARVSIDWTESSRLGIARARAMCNLAETNQHPGWKSFWLVHVHLFPALLSLAFATGKKILTFPQNFCACFAEQCDWRGK